MQPPPQDAYPQQPYYPPQQMNQGQPPVPMQNTMMPNHNGFPFPQQPQYQPRKTNPVPIIIAVVVVALVVVAVLVNIDLDDLLDNDPLMPREGFRSFYVSEFFINDEYRIDLDRQQVWYRNHELGFTYACSEVKNCTNGFPVSSCSDTAKTVLQRFTVHPDAKRTSTLTVNRVVGFRIYQIQCTNYEYGENAWCFTNDRIRIVKWREDGEDKRLFLSNFRDLEENEIPNQCLL
ncbi:hypothetical protein GEMRC1_011689 [Eukaryota sp. GEM-RC1]